jgi:serine/threonine protein kinase/tetratricopeptide (TPR) repeat protein
MVQQAVETFVELPPNIGPYRILGRVSSGGMGVIYEGIRPGDAETVAVKTVIKIHRKLLASLRAEVLALRRIQHPGVVRILAEGLTEQQPWYAMELLKGKTLAAIYDELWPGRKDLKKTAATTVSPAVTPHAPSVASSPAGSWPATPNLPRHHHSPASITEILSIYRRLCAPLEFMKAEGIVHRDLKPSNVMVRPDGSPVILDFGLASREFGAAGRDSLEFYGRFVGSLPYVAPEQIRNEIVDARADLYALGCMIYEHLTGAPPFIGNDAHEVRDRQLSEEPLPPSHRCDGIPPEVDRIVLALLAKRPRDRIGHAAELAAALGALGVPDGPDQPPPRNNGVSHLCRPEIVGRGNVIDRISLACQTALSSNRGSLWFVGGESGMGKTYLAAELARQASHHGLQVIPGSCVSVGLGPSNIEPAARPMQAFRRLFEILADRCREGGPAAAQAIFQGRTNLFVPYEESLATLPDQAADSEPAGLPPEASRQRLFTALADVLARLASDHPALVVLDDLQWADELSLGFLKSLSATLFAGTALVMVCLYRSDEMTTDLATITKRPDATHLDLERLDQGAVTSMVRDMLAMNNPPAPFVRYLHDRSKGNPFFVAEYLRLAAAEGVLRRHEGRWALAELGAGGSNDDRLESLPLPLSIRELVTQRLARLPDRERRLMEVAAVVGRDLDLDLLQEISGMNEGDILEGMRDLVARQLVETPPGESPRFGHHRIREVAYSTITPERLSRWHQAAGEALERRADRDQLAALAHHFECAGDRLRATTYLEQLGDEALARFSNQEAARAFGRLLQWGDPGDDGKATLRRARWERGYGDALHGLGRMEDSSVHLGRATKLLGEPRPAGAVRTALSIAVELAQQLRTVVRGASTAVGDAATREAAREASRAYDRLLQIAYYTGKPADMFLATFRTLNLAEKAGPVPELAMAYSIAHAVAGIIPLPAVADFYLRRAKGALAQTHDPAVDSYLQLLAGVYQSGAARWQEAREALERGIAIAEQIGFGRRVDELRLGLSNWHFLQGSYREAGRQTALYRTAAIDRGDRQAEAWCRLMRGQVDLVQGSPEEALAGAETVSAFADALQRSELIWTHALAAASREQLGRFEEARALAGKALEQILDGPPVTFYCIESYGLTAEVSLRLLARGHGGTEAGAFARAACRALRAFARVFPSARPRAALHAGTLAALEGRSGRAVVLWTRAHSLAQKLGMAPDLVAADRALGRAARDSELGRARLRAALDRATQLEAWRVVEEIKSDLG